MSHSALIYWDSDEFYAGVQLISRPAWAYLAALAKGCGCDQIFVAGQQPPTGEQITPLTTEFAPSPSLFAPLPVDENLLVFFECLPALTRATAAKLISAENNLLTDAEHRPLALFAPMELLRKLSGRRDTLEEELRALGPLLTEVSLTPEDGAIVTDGLTLYQCQELLRGRINRHHMEAGVVVVDPNTTHISPDALIEPGATILPGCFLYGRTHVEATAVIGPNTWLEDSIVGCGATVNSSHVLGSAIGAQTTVGPFAYVRPGCDVGDHVRIGDFVELKKAKVGNGTKIAHLSYLGDIELGQRCNIGGGVIVVNYDGKKKHKTIVGDDCFVGCNVNLISPVHLGNDSYVSAGSTITDNVPDQALAIARARQVNKEEWVRRRREQDLL